jgi:hypothetical protein
MHPIASVRAYRVEGHSIPLLRVALVISAISPALVSTNAMRWKRGIISIIWSTFLRDEPWRTPGNPQDLTNGA